MNKLRSLIESGLVDRGDGTIFDVKTNLLWAKESSPYKFNSQEIEQYCKDLTLGGYTDWRLPTTDEIKTISVFGSRYLINPIFECEGRVFWTLNPNNKMNPDIYCLSFLHSGAYCYLGLLYSYVRAVRNNV